MEDIKDVILNEYQVRKTKAQKLSFRNYIKDRYENMGYTVTLDSIKSSTNIIIGNINECKIILSAHYDTCAVLPFPNFIIPNSLVGFVLSQLIVLFFMLFMPVFISSILLALLSVPLTITKLINNLFILFIAWWVMFGYQNKHTVNDNTSGVLTILKVLEKLPSELKDKVCIILFDNEEKGLLGSKGLAKKYPHIKDDILVINYDCVSDGDDILFFPHKCIKNDESIISLIDECYKGNDKKKISVNKGFGFYPSDNLSFKKSFGVCALRKCAGFNYLGRIHTYKDTVYDKDNIELLVNGSVKIIERVE